ncbi:hypothetical protein BLX88_26080, partial [Bacillus obstructivus]
HDDPAAGRGNVHIEELMERAREEVGYDQEHDRDPTRGAQAAGSVLHGGDAQDRYSFRRTKVV